MSRKTFTQTASVVFSLIAVLHALRLLTGSEVVVGGWSAPHWVSGVAAVLFGYLGYSGFNLKS